MKKVTIPLCLFMALSILNSCDKDNPDPTNVNGTSSGVYVSGINGPGLSVAAYWKDGVVTNLLWDRSAVSSANAITVSGSCARFSKNFIS